MNFQKAFLILTISILFNLPSLAQQPPNQPPLPPQQPVMQGAPPQLQPAMQQDAPPLSLPPNILVVGKERESFQKVLIDEATVGVEKVVTLIIFDRDPSADLSCITYGLPASAKFDFKKDEKNKNRATATLVWKPTKQDKDKLSNFHTIVVEVTNGKSSNKLALSYKLN